MRVLESLQGLIYGREAVDAAVLDGANVALWFANAGTGEVSCNHAAAALLGCVDGGAPHTLASLSSYAYGTDAGRLALRIAHVLESRTAESVEFRAVRRDGSLRHLQMVLLPLRDGSLVGAMQDLVDAARSTAGAWERSAPLTSLRIVQAMPVPAYVLDRDLDRFLVATDALHDLLGLARDMAPSLRDLIAVVHPADRARVEARLLHDGLSTPSSDEAFRYRVETAARGVRWISHREIAFRRDAESGAARIIGVLEDITDDVLAQDRAAAAEQWLRMVGDCMREVIAAHDQEGRVTWVSASFERLTGLRESDLVGRVLADLAHPEDRALLQESLVTTRVRGSTTVRWRLKAASGAYLRVRTEIDRREPGRATEPARLAAVRFVSRTDDHGWEQDLADRGAEIERLRSHAGLLGESLRELANLLTVVGTSVETMESSAEIARSVDEASAIARHVHAQYAAVDAPVRPVDVGRTVTGFERSLRRLVGDRRQIAISIAPDLPLARIDEWELEEAVTGLVLNARDVTPSDATIELLVRAVTLEGPRPHAHGVVPAGEYVTVVVRDLGRGFSPAMLAQAFSIGSARRDPVRPAGRTLGVIRRSIDHAGGAVTIESVPGAGATVTLWLRLATPESMEPIAERGRRLRVLLVEPDRVVRESTARALEHRAERIDLTTAESGAEALRLLAEADERERPELVVTAVVMPSIGSRELGGRELGETIARRFPRVRVAYVSGYIGNGDRGGTIAGLEPLLAKPYRAETFLRFVERAMELAASA